MSECFDARNVSEHMEECQSCKKTWPVIVEITSYLDVWVSYEWDRHFVLDEDMVERRLVLINSVQMFASTLNDPSNWDAGILATGKVKEERTDKTSEEVLASISHGISEVISTFSEESPWACAFGVVFMTLLNFDQMSALYRNMMVEHMSKDEEALVWVDKFLDEYEQDKVKAKLLLDRANEGLV